jgi:hypothetical protein
LASSSIFLVFKMGWVGGTMSKHASEEVGADLEAPFENVCAKITVSMNLIVWVRILSKKEKTEKINMQTSTTSLCARKRY